MLGRLPRRVAAAVAPLAIFTAMLSPARGVPFTVVHWTHPPNQETSFFVLAGADPTVEIRASQIGSNRAEIDTLTKMGSVSAFPPLDGDGVIVETFFTYHAHTYYLVAQRTMFGDEFTLEWLDTSSSPHTYHHLPCSDCTGKWDSKNDTVSFHMSMASFNKAVASQHVPGVAKGARLTNLETDSDSYKGAPGAGGLVSAADTSKPADPTTALVIP